VLQALIWIFRSESFLVAFFCGADSADALMTYRHQQFCPLAIVPCLCSACMYFVAWTFHDVAPLPVPLMSCAVGLLFAAVGTSIYRTTIADEGEELVLSFGPMTVYEKRFRYDNMTAVELGQLRFFDGLAGMVNLRREFVWNPRPGSHDCIVIHLKEGFFRAVRIGTNDGANLARFLNDRLQQEQVRKVPRGRPADLLDE
jgi:hypothetical protein